MRKKHKVALLVPIVLIIVELGLLAALFLRGRVIDVLSPHGPVAGKEQHLMIFGALLSLIVVVPVFVMTFFIVWKYRESNTRAIYRPEWDHSRVLETIWWGVPLALITVLSVVTWQSSHALDPFRPLDSAAKPLTIQVVALDWKWLFIYPEQDIATVNYVEFPADVPIDFEITADAPMNSFWIPQLGGQIYAMSGMSTNLHLMADTPGTYRGSSANISGRGFSGMRFNAVAASQTDFDGWVRTVKQSPKRLSLDEYDKLARPSQDNPVLLYAASEDGLYNQIVTKFTPYGHGHEAATR